jgi:hypothetical protein
LPFFVVFFAEDFLVVDLDFFLAAMALGTSFLFRNVKLESFLVNDFLLATIFFSRPQSPPRRALRCVRARSSPPRAMLSARRAPP